MQEGLHLIEVTMTLFCAYMEFVGGYTCNRPREVTIIKSDVERGGSEIWSYLYLFTPPFLQNKILCTCTSLVHDLSVTNCTYSVPSFVVMTNDNRALLFNCEFLNCAIG